MVEKPIEIGLSERNLINKPIKIYITKDMANLIEVYEDFLLLAVEETLRLPFYEIMARYGEFDDYDFTIPVIVYVDEERAKAWENTPNKVKNRLIMAINGRFTEMVYSDIYIHEKFFK
jgi:hypothetical protein